MNGARTTTQRQEAVAIVGTGQTPFRSRHDDKTYPELAQDAVVLALNDAGIGPDEVDAVVFSMAPTQFMGVADVEKWAVDYTWARSKPFLRIHTGGATGGSALQAGWSHVASGYYRTVLVVGADRITETPDAQHVLNLIWDQFYEQDFALNTVTMTALAAQRYMHRYGTTEEQFARVVVRGRGNAMRNPNAHLKGHITVDDVINSPRVSWPYKLFDICPRSAGAGAVVLTTESAARERRARPAFITGIGGIANTVYMGDRMTPKADTDFADQGEMVLAARECYAQAGITDPMAQIDVAELYDPFSTFQFPQLESLGFCARGTAQNLSDEGAFDMGGQLAVNPSGGTLCTNPIGVTGLVRIIEAARQVMGTAGDMQVANVHNALATAAGGSTQFFTTTLISDEPRTGNAT
ncbi:acetyl-CoA acetyltransferase [Variovorax paradoxus]|jgi:acetyl-CoA C-acetyltransferase|uniref:thiolase family protein n=1 Tax=Variovorax paradoxus TaxID=34073 RepID=UPI0006E6A30A|nr:acetyl-CoA acetyltransferase [Variovorax paradoxus]KPV03410.1 acetyl-CoA acetyltransferase [Variovorax paradoxus]KPV04693.1 acetyl-CoA acetyltransferase [Variovorax paradoxus]KPV19203.1 acetyl-CoA acetyltransferase [Variovorax paradoxus]KPV30215.1 acetyl-CoA acetyltransferase [Variovorax paradoxus]